jgi:hypothetical protein
MQLMRLSAPKLQINQLCNPKADHIAIFLAYGYCTETLHFTSNLVFPINWFQRRRKYFYGLGIQVQIISTSILAVWTDTDTVNFSALLVETACKVTHSILYQFVNSRTHWVLIRRTAGILSFLALYQLHLSLSICSLFLRRSIYFRESISKENKQSVPHPQFPKH